LDVIQREQYYIDLLKPEYNILKVAGSSLGHKHTEESRAQMSATHLSRTWSEEHKAKLIENITKLNSNPEQQAKSRERIIRYNLTKSIKVEVLDLETNLTSTYDSIRKAAEALNCAKNSIHYFEKQKLEKGINSPLRGRYLITVIRNQ
jgi:group I intron endonuclease